MSEVGFTKEHAAMRSASEATEAEVSEAEVSTATAATSLSTLPESPTSRDLDSPTMFDCALDGAGADGGLFARLSSSPDTVADTTLAALRR